MSVKHLRVGELPRLGEIHSRVRAALSDVEGLARTEVAWARLPVPATNGALLLALSIIGAHGPTLPGIDVTLVTESTVAAIELYRTDRVRNRVLRVMAAALPASVFWRIHLQPRQCDRPIGGKLGDASIDSFVLVHEKDEIYAASENSDMNTNDPTTPDSVTAASDNDPLLLQRVMETIRDTCGANADRDSALEARLRALLTAGPFRPGQLLTAAALNDLSSRIERIESALERLGQTDPKSVGTIEIYGDQQ